MASETPIGGAKFWIEDGDTVGGELVLPHLGHLSNAFYARFLNHRGRRPLLPAGAMASATNNKDGSLKLDVAVERTAAPLSDIQVALEALKAAVAIVEEIAR